MYFFRSLLIAKDGTTMDMNGINSASYRFEINLEQLIYAEYTP